MVLSGRLSNPVIERQLASFTLAAPGEFLPRRLNPKPVRRRKILDDGELEMMTTRYAAGQSVKHLAASYDIHHTTVSALWKDQGVRLRQTSLSPEEIEAAHNLRALGWSYARIAERLGVAPETVRRRLRKAA